jgi:hypothetical protein
MHLRIPFPISFPFNAQNIGSEIYVTYAPAGRPAQVSAVAGQGGVVVFDDREFEK